jgi:hypothetical protein
MTLVFLQVLFPIFDLQNDIILGCVYVPPEGSKYSNSESFDEIEKELIALSKDSNMHSAIVGDLTSKNSLRHLCFCKFFFRFLYPGLCENLRCIY